MAAALGGALLARGIRDARRGSLGGAALAVAGGVLAYQALRGGPPLSEALPRALGLGKADAGGGPDGAGADVAVERSITVGRPADELYRLWQDPGTMPRVAGHAAAVADRGGGRTHWSVRLPGGRQVAWDAELVEDRPGELLRWRSTGGAAVPAEAEVRFRPGPPDWGTEVTLRVRAAPLGGPLGAGVLRGLGAAPGRLLAAKALHRFKSLAETGEVPTLTRQPAARHDGRDR